jgi:hypothetical protein
MQTHTWHSNPCEWLKSNGICPVSLRIAFINATDRLRIRIWRRRKLRQLNEEWQRACVTDRCHDTSQIYKCVLTIFIIIICGMGRVYRKSTSMSQPAYWTIIPGHSTALYATHLQFDISANALEITAMQSPKWNIWRVVDCTWRIFIA